MRFSTMIIVTVLLAILGYFLVAAGVKALDDGQQRQNAAIAEALR